MSKHAVRLLLAVLAVLVASAAFAVGPASPSTDQAFLDSLRAPATADAPATLTGSDFTPAPIVKSCFYQCNKCGTNKVQLCSLCNGVSSCEPCHSGTACAI